MLKTKGCGDIQELLADYSVGSLGWRATRSVERHLSRCAACALELESLHSVMELVEQDAYREPPAGLWNGVYNRLSSAEQPRVTPSPSRIRWLRRPLVAFVAGVSALVLLLGLTVSQLQRPPLPSPVDVGADEYVQGHAILAQDQLFANRINLTLVAATAGAERAKNGKL